MNKVLYKLLFLACVLIQLISCGSDTSSSKSKLQANVKYENFKPIKIYERGFKPEKANLKTSEGVLDQYLSALLTKDKSKLLSLYKKDDSDNQRWVRLLDAQDIAFKKIEVKSRLVWQKYNVYEVTTYYMDNTPGLIPKKDPGSDKFLFTYCPNESCYISIPDSHWSIDEENMFYDLFYMMEEGNTVLSMGDMINDANTFKYRFNPDKTNYSDNEINVKLYSKILNGKVITINEANISDIEDPITSTVVNFIQTVQSWKPENVDSKDPVYIKRVDEIFSHEKYSARANNKSFPLVEANTYRARANNHGCRWTRSDRFIAEIRRWEKVQFVALVHENEYVQVVLKSLTAEEPEYNYNPGYNYNVISLIRNEPGNYSLGFSGGTFTKFFCNNDYLPEFTNYMERKVKS